MNDKTGISYLITPLGIPKAGDLCRSYKLTATRSGKSKTSDGRACRSGDGTWRPA